MSVRHLGGSPVHKYPTCPNTVKDGSNTVKDESDIGEVIWSGENWLSAEAHSSPTPCGSISDPDHLSSVKSQTTSYTHSGPQILHTT